MFQTEFGGLVWFPYVILILMLLIGYSIYRAQRGRKDRKKKKKLFHERSELERELQAEIDAMENRKGTKTVEPNTDPDQVLEPPRDVREEMDELKKQL